MMHHGNEKKNYGVMIMLAMVVALIIWLFIESRQRTREIDDVLKQTIIKN
jgi:hypothetical protein